MAEAAETAGKFLDEALGMLAWLDERGRRPFRSSEFAEEFGIPYLTALRRLHAAEKRGLVRAERIHSNLIQWSRA